MSDVLAYFGMIKNYRPIVRDFAFHRYNKGDSVADLFERYPTNRTLKLEHFSILYDGYWANRSNSTSFEVLAKDGKLVRAGAFGSVNGIPWDFTFFHATNDAELDRQLNREDSEYEKQYYPKEKTLDIPTQP